jgi:hypothetical protein
MVDGYPVGFELVIGRAENGPPAVLTPHVVEFVPADSHIGVMIVSHGEVAERHCSAEGVLSVGARRALGQTP